ncbi:hypothetical protein BDZ97DRAFT_1760767 [Flammula alnicola]|nr:hypothetical protein BDZ97DRAFT_1760767 [Flammula alnicola]
MSSSTTVAGGTSSQPDHSIRTIHGVTGGFEILKGGIAPGALHKSDHRFDPPKCHPNTREAVLKRIMDWIYASKDRAAWIMWLHGPAGSGKSAIAQSIAELCEKAKVLLASFFFLKTDPTRSHEGYLVATLAYQLALSIPDARDIITNVIDDDPLICGRSLATQLKSLVVDPLVHLRNKGLIFEDDSSPQVIVIDALDECYGHHVQSNIIRAIIDVVRSAKLPILFLVASRPEPHLTMTFSSKTATHLTMRLPLDDSYLPHADIHAFLKDKFDDIKKNHPCKDKLSPAWPAAEVIQHLVERSSGQFLYASTVTKHLASAHQHPMLTLEAILGLRPTHYDTPFAELDALYAHIFTSASDIQNALLFLGYRIFGGLASVRDIEAFLFLEPGAIKSTLTEITALVACERDALTFHHTSLMDFLLDSSRSQHFYLDPSMSNAEFAHRWFEQIHSYSYDKWPMKYRVSALLQHLKHAAPTEDLHTDIMKFRPALAFELSPPKHITIAQMSDFLFALNGLGFEDGRQLYLHHLKIIHPVVRDSFPEYYASFCRHHNVRPHSRAKGWFRSFRRRILSL